MRTKIFKNVGLLVFIVVLISDLLFTGLMYQQFLNQLKNEVKSKTTYVKAAVELDGLDYLQSLEKGDDMFRITLIDTDGSVLYDSVENAADMENHAEREEFVEALSTSTGEALRYSGTLGENTYYYAVRLSDGTVLRLSSAMRNVLSALGNTLPLLVLFVLIVLGASFVAANFMAMRLTEPINQLDLEHPLENEVYDELSPLLMRLENQNRQISRQINQEKKQQMEFQTVTQNMKEGLILLNRDEEILLINEACYDIFDCEDTAGIGKHYLTISREKILTEAVKAALSGKHDDFSITLDGRIYMIHATPVTGYERVTGAVLLITDVTESMQAQKHRQEFVANVSHELKTPLMSISGYAEIIQDGIAKEEDIPKFSARIFQEAKRLTTLVEDIIKLSELDDASIEDIKDSVELKMLANEVVSYLQDEASKKKVSLSLEGEEVTVTGERNLLEEMIYNLCDNAIKYNVEGGCVAVKVSKQNGIGSITVSDTGIGIPKESQERVFERFYRVDKSHSRESGGTGLGLSIVKHAAMLHKATIQMDSTPGKGTSISVIFPAVNEI